MVTKKRIDERTTMKNYNVTYRGKDGRPQVMEIVASDRADVFHQLESKGISFARGSGMRRKELGGLSVVAACASVT